MFILKNTARSKYLYQSLLFSSINSNSFCGKFSDKNSKDKKLQINEQNQDLPPAQTPVQDKNQKPNKKPKDPKKDKDGKPEKPEKENYIKNIGIILRKTYNDIFLMNLKNNCCIYYCRFNEGDDAEKTDAKGNKVEKHFVYIYVSYLDNYKLIAKTKYVTSDREKLDEILETYDLEFKLLGFNCCLRESGCFHIGDFRDILEKFLKLCDSEGILINKIKEPLITISLKVYRVKEKDKEYKLWLGLINNNLYYEPKFTKDKRLLIPMNDFDYGRLESGNCSFNGIYAYSNDDNEDKKLYFYRLVNTGHYDIGNYSYIQIEGAPSDNFKIEKNNFKDICGDKRYDIKIIN